MKISVRILLLFMFIITVGRFAYTQDSIAQNVVRYNVMMTGGRLLPTGNSNIEREHNGSGYGLRFRLPMKKILSIQTGLSYYIFKYIEPQPYPADIIQPNVGLIEPLFDSYRTVNGHPDGFWFPSLKNTYLAIDLSTNISVINTINYFFNKKSSWDLSVDMGIGFMQKSIFLDLYDETKHVYVDLVNKVNLSNESFDTFSGRKHIRQSIGSLYDGKYETRSNVNKLNYLFYTYGLSLTKLIFKNIEVGLNYKVLKYKNSDEINALPNRTFNSIATQDEKLRIISIMIGWSW